MKKNVFCRAVALALCLILCAGALAEDTQHGQVLESMRQNIRKILSTNDMTVTMYENYTQKDASYTLPEKFDLRDTGVVPEIRNQKNWGTCWGFASIAAAETSILSGLGLTVDEYRELYGEDLDLSEKHLAWFGVSHLPLASDYPEGEYPYNDAQAGEGIYIVNEDTDGYAARYNVGGVMGYASTAFANGSGPVSEELFPYLANDGTESTASDWSIDESARFMVYYELLESSMLPSPATRDANGEYVYNASATQAIKRELLEGRGVAIAYHGDQAIDPEAETNMANDMLKALGFTEEDIALYQRFSLGETTNIKDLTDDELLLCIKLFVVGMTGKVPDDETVLPLIANLREQISGEDVQNEDAMVALLTLLSQFAPSTADTQTESEETTISVQDALLLLGVDPDRYAEYVQKRSEAENVVYINTDTYAQYTDNVYAPVTHGVCIIGWDDHYSADNFPSDHRPPADGAWIVRNSWGEDYGNDGYFYLSYYDETISIPESFRFVTEDDGNNTSKMSILSYDLLPADSVSNIRTDTPVYSANIFANEEDEDAVLCYVSLLTSEHNVTATVNVYLLDEDAQTPEDGVLLDTVTETYEYAGYHRVELHQNYLVGQGERLGIVQTQRMEKDGEYVYLTPYTAGSTDAFRQLQNIFETNAGYRLNVYAQTRVNSGESFVYLDGKWEDWSDILSELDSSDALAAYFCIDNIALKAYLYPASELYAAHDFDRSYSYFGSTAHICDDCGYTLIEARTQAPAA